MMCMTNIRYMKYMKYMKCMKLVVYASPHISYKYQSIACFLLSCIIMVSQ